MIENELVRHAKAGNKEALNSLLAGIDSYLYEIAYKQVQHAADAHDIAQECAIRICRSIQNFEEKSQFKTWVTRIVLNCCYDWRRKKQAQGEEQMQVSIDHVSFQEEHHILDRIEREELRTAILQLPKVTRSILLMRCEGLKYKEIAAELNIPINTVASEINRATHKLRLQLQCS